MLGSWVTLLSAARVDRPRNDRPRPERCAIVEIATIITDANSRVIEEGPNLVIHQPEDVLAVMGDYVRELHTRSGLLERIRTSTVTTEEACPETLAFITRHCQNGTALLCGNSVWKDRAFLERYMPEIVAHLNYRIIDVSTVKELVRRWCPPEKHAPKKRETHRALDDIRESIEELAYYRALLFSPFKPAA